MTDITDQPIRDMLEWARIAVASKDNQEHEPWVTAARYILATVPAPAPTFAERLEYRADMLDNGDPDGDTPQALRDLAARAEQIEQERDQAKKIAELNLNTAAEMKIQRDNLRAEVERLTTERDREKAISKGWMEAHQKLAEHHAESVTVATVAPEENVAADQQANTQGILSGSLPDPADVKPGEAWIVNIDGVEIVPGFKASVGWICYRLFGGTTKSIGDERITLVSRLVPAPRVITNPDELDRLAEGTIVRDKDGDAWRRTCDEWTTTADYGRFASWAVSRSGPVTVLWEPDA